MWRKYTVPSPNYVWHLDGTHKLVRWKLVFHVGIDGFSRLIVYCGCSANNKSLTVLNLFKEAEEQYGLSLRMRTDFGMENLRVWEYMLQKRRNSNVLITGSSVHNQRIERLNRQVNTQVVNGFYNEFVQLEEDHMLDPMNDTDLFCLHYVYLPVINRRLTEFAAAHKNHALSTAHNYSPMQLYHLNYRLLQLQNLDSSASINIRDIVQQSRCTVNVEPIASPLSEEAQTRLDAILTQNSGLAASVMYERVIQFVADFMQRNTP